MNSLKRHDNGNPRRKGNKRRPSEVLGTSFYENRISSGSCRKDNSYQKFKVKRYKKTGCYFHTRTILYHREGRTLWVTADNAIQIKGNNKR